MSDKPWKRLERDVAKYFGTKRRLRGNDFSQSDVEVLATLKDWLKYPQENFGIVVECKYRQSQPLIDLVTDTDEKASFYCKPVVLMGNYILCCLQDFAEVFVTLTKDHLSLDDLDKLNFRKVTKKVPDYLESYMQQATEYTTRQSSITLLPVVCLAKANSKYKVVIFSRDALKAFNKSLHKSNETTEHSS